MILLVDDNAEDAELIRGTLERAWGAAPVMWVRTGEEALAYLKGEGGYANRKTFPFPKLVMIDLGSPGVSGWGVLAWLRREPRFVGLPVVVVTGSNLQRQIQMAYEMGANSFVVKRPEMGGFLSDMREVAKYWLDVCALPEAARSGAGGS